MSLRDFFDFFLIFFKCPRVNPIVCHVSKSMFYIQFGPYICIFLFNLVPILFKIDQFCPYRIYDQI